jgi:hypothetical protein
MPPNDLNRIEDAFAEVSVGCALRSRALNLAETFRTRRGGPELFRLPTLGRRDGALLWATAYSVRSRRYVEERTATPSAFQFRELKSNIMNG